MFICFGEWLDFFVVVDMEFDMWSKLKLNRLLKTKKKFMSPAHFSYPKKALLYEFMSFDGKKSAKKFQLHSQIINYTAINYTAINFLAKNSNTKKNREMKTGY